MKEASQPHVYTYIYGAADTGKNQRRFHSTAWTWISVYMISRMELLVLSRIITPIGRFFYYSILVCQKNPEVQ